MPADTRPGRSGRRRSPQIALVSMMATCPILVAGACIQLTGSTTCPAFQSASVSTGNGVVGYFPFMQPISDVASFDEALREYVRTTYVQDKYQVRFGCGNIDLANTTELYARFTTTTVCNSIIQNSINDCSLTTKESEPVCAETCADFASSVALVTADNDLCSHPNNGVTDLVRGEFTTCALPVGALSGNACITGSENEPENCGFGNSTIGLCSYCARGGINSTDTCCYSSNAESRCQGVELPTIFPTMSFTTPTASADPSADSNGHDNRGGLSGGAIAGIVIGALAGLLLLGAMLFLCLRRSRRSKHSQQENVLNQPSPPRTGTSMAQRQSTPQGFEVLPGGRIARMSALEGHSSDSAARNGATAGATAAAGYAAGRRKGEKGDNMSATSDYNDSPESDTRAGAGVLRRPPTTMRRHSSVSSSSQLDPHSPGSAGGVSSARGVAPSQQSEQLPFFKDYYSADDIHPGDRVAVLWAYQPRAVDEFTLERGDMLKVVGIWDDGWATGVMLDENAEDWEARRQAQRDSGVSNASAKRDPSPPLSGEIKAFPLVCVCLPEHWRKTIEGDGSTDAASTSHY